MVSTRLGLNNTAKASREQLHHGVCRGKVHTSRLQFRCSDWGKERRELLLVRDAVRDLPSALDNHAAC